MARQKLGAFKRIKQKRNRKLVEKKKKIEKILAAEAAETAPVKEAVAELVAAQKEATAAENKAINAKAAGPKLVSPAKVQSLQRQAEAKVVVVKQLEEKAKAAAPAAPSSLEVSLSVFDWTQVLLEAAVDELKISKWYAVGGAALLAALYFVAEKQGWLDFLNF